MPCAVFMNAVGNHTFINNLDVRLLKAFSKNAHFWMCLPVEMVADMMATAQLGSKMDLNDAFQAAQVIADAKKIDWDVVVSIFRTQFPQIVNKVEDEKTNWLIGFKIPHIFGEHH